MLLNLGAATGGVPGGCFPADTLVLTKDGQKPIQHVRDDDLVWGYDFAAREWVLRQVAETYVHDFDGEMVSVTIADEMVEATANHPFWVVEGDGLAGRNCSDHAPESPSNSRTPGRWVDAGDLLVGDVLLLKQANRRRSLD